MPKKELLNARSIQILMNRLTCQLIENHGSFENAVLIGLQPRGTFLAKRMQNLLKEQGVDAKLGSLDITFFRDDFRRRNMPLQANQTQINFLLEGKDVIFIDDVLYTGRSVRSALDAIQSFGRPRSVELLVLIDRRFSRELPIQPDYSGKRVDSLSGDRVAVEWKEEHGNDDIVYILKADQ